MKTYVLAAIVVLLPVVVMWGYVYIRDRVHGEPLAHILKGVGFGIASALIGLLIATPADMFLKQVPFETSSASLMFKEAFLTAALPVEFIKLVMLCIFLQRSRLFKKSGNGISCAVAISMGFIAFNNTFYVVADIADLKDFAIMRALLAVPAHLLLGILMGYYYSLARIHSGGKQALYIVLAFVVPVVLHSLFDVMIMIARPGTIILGYSTVLLLILCAFLNLHVHRRVKDLNDLRVKNAG